jgi:hypothetical protein
VSTGIVDGINASIDIKERNVFIAHPDASARTEWNLAQLSHLNKFTHVMRSSSASLLSHPEIPAP